MRKLVPKLEHSRSHTTFLDLDITMSNGKYQLISMRKREHFFFIVHMPNLHSNISSSIFYGTVISEILHITRSSSSVLRFYDKSSSLITLMEKQAEIGENL